MAQHDMEITTAEANTGIAFRAAVNAALQALATNNSGAGDPATTYPYQFKVDTGSTPKVFYMRKGDNTAWTRLGYIDSNGMLILDRAITSVTGAYTASLSDDIILASGTFTITLSAISSLSGAAFSKEFTIINDGTGVVTVDGNGTEKIGEQLAVALKSGETLVIAANDGTAWKRLNDVSYAMRTEDMFPDFVISGLLGTDPGASLTMTTPQGTAYIGGRRIVKQTGDADLTHTYNNSSDIYDYLRVDGAIVHQAVANGAGEPSQPSSTIKLQKVVTNGTEITGVTDMRPLVGMAASQTKAANKIPIADANGLLSGWLNPSSIRDIARDLIVMNNSTNPTYQIDIDASDIITQDSGGNNYMVSSVNLTANITVSGANGLDTGSEAGSTWYYVWVIYNGTTVASLLSTSATAPTMPSGYTYKAKVGSVRNDASSNFSVFHKRGQRVNIDETLILANGNSNTWASVTFTTIVPPEAKVIYGVGIEKTASARFWCVAPAGSNFARIWHRHYGPDTLGVSGYFTLMLQTAQTLYWITETSSDLFLYINGYEC